MTQPVDPSMGAMIARMYPAQPPVERTGENTPNFVMQEPPSTPTHANAGGYGAAAPMTVPQAGYGPNDRPVPSLAQFNQAFAQPAAPSLHRLNDSPSVGGGWEDVEPAPAPVTASPNPAYAQWQEVQRRLSGVRKQRDEGIGAEREATRRVGEGMAGEAEALAGGKAEEEGAQLAEKQATEERATKRQAMADERLQKIDDFSKQLAEQKLDPNRLWNNASTGAKNLWTIQAALSGALGGLQHRDIATALQEAQARDIEAQKFNFETAKGRLRDMDSLYARAYQATGDADEAKHLAGIMGLEVAKKQTESMVAGAQSTTARARGDVAIAKIDETIADAMHHDIGEDVSMPAPAKMIYSGGGSAGPSEKEVEARKLKLLDKAREEGIELSPHDAYRQAAEDLAPRGGRTVQSLSKPAKEGAAGADKSLPVPGALEQAVLGSSTNWDLRRHVQGTDAYSNAQVQGQYNTHIEAFAHARLGIRSPEGMEQVMHPYMIQPGDSPSTISQKVAGFKQMAANAPMAAPADVGFQE